MSGPAWTPETAAIASTTIPYTGVSATYGVQNTDCVVNCTANTFTVTMPTAVGKEGQYFIIKNSGTGIITIDGYNSETIDGQATKVMAVQYESYYIVSDNANWIVV
jgi:hypothetical protein